MKRVASLSWALARALPVALLAAGCGGPTDGSGFMARSDLAAPLVQPVTGAESGGGAGFGEALFLLPPEAGQMTRVRERHFPNGTRQEIVLAGAPQGENVIDVSIRTNGGDQVGRGMLQIGRPSERGVRNEIVSRFPDVRMSIVTQPRGNALGNFGLAIGRHANGSRCVFAWQWIDDIRESSPHVSSFSRMGAMFSSHTTSVSIRIRLCRNEMTVDDLAGLIEGLQPGERAALDRVMSMDRRSFAAGGSAQDLGGGRGVTPVGTLESAIGGPPATRAAAPPPQRDPAPAAVRPRRAAAKPAPKPAPKVVARPAPKVAARAAPKPAQRVATTPEPQYGLGGTRYMAPMTDSGAPTAVSSIPASARQLDPSLPMAAYRGPGRCAHDGRGDAAHALSALTLYATRPGGFKEPPGKEPAPRAKRFVNRNGLADCGAPEVRVGALRR